MNDKDIVSILSGYLDNSDLKLVSKDWNEGFNMMMKTWYKDFKLQYPGINRDQNGKQYSTIMTSLHESIISGDAEPLIKLLSYDGYLPINWVSLFWIIYYYFQDDNDVIKLYKPKNKYFDSMHRWIANMHHASDAMELQYFRLFYQLIHNNSSYASSFSVISRHTISELSSAYFNTEYEVDDIFAYIGIPFNADKNNTMPYRNYLYGRSNTLNPQWKKYVELFDKEDDEDSIIYGALNILDLVRVLHADRVDLLEFLNPTKEQLDHVKKDVYMYGYCYDWIEKRYPSIDLNNGRKYLFK